MYIKVYGTITISEENISDFDLRTLNKMLYSIGNIEGITKYRAEKISTFRYQTQENISKLSAILHDLMQNYPHIVHLIDIKGTNVFEKYSETTRYYFDRTYLLNQTTSIKSFN